MRTLGALLLLGCGLTSATPPGGLLCDRFSVASDALEQALAAAKPNDCVILTSGTYEGAFELPAEVSLSGANGASVTLTGDGSGRPVLTIRGGKRSTVRGLKIDSSRGTGVAIDPGPANLLGVVVQGNSSHAALTATCDRGACGEVTLEDTELLGSTVGVLAAGGQVQLLRGRVAQMGGTRLTHGSGVVASKRAQVRVSGTTIEDNAKIGVLVDGPATRLTLDQAVVRRNLERGVWVQNAADGGVEIIGGAISANRLVGVGIRDSAGVRLTGVEISDTALVEVPTGIAQKEAVGDGVGLFAGARGVVLDLVRATGNGRAQILADGSGEGVRATPAAVSGGQFRVVLQRGATVEVPAGLIDDPGRELATQSAAVPVTP